MYDQSNILILNTAIKVEIDLFNELVKKMDLNTLNVDAIRNLVLGDKKFLKYVATISSMDKNKCRITPYVTKDLSAVVDALNNNPNKDYSYFYDDKSITVEKTSVANVTMFNKQLVQVGLKAKNTIGNLVRIELQKLDSENAEVKRKFKDLISKTQKQCNASIDNVIKEKKIK